jgi:hypothetical protein
MRALRSRTGLLWPGLGLLGSVLIALTSAELFAHDPITWWWSLPLPGHHGLHMSLLWLGVLLLAVAWLGLGARLGLPLTSRRPVPRSGRGAPPTARDVTIVAALWATPLLLAPALFSFDMYSYLAQGSILWHGLNPYKVAPTVLPHLGQGPLLQAVSPAWRTTTAPYGPVFIALAGAIATIAGGHLALGVSLLRILVLIGMGLLAVFVPRLARSLGADPARAAWLVLASPLVLLYLVGSGHNDALMAGVMVCGVALAVERRPLLGIAVCILAATIKLPAVVAAGCIAIVWVRSLPAARRPAAIAQAVGVTIAIFLAVGVATGTGISWLSGSLFSTPESAHVSITPATAFAVSIWEILHGIHHTYLVHGVRRILPHAAIGLESAGVDIGMGAAALFALILWLRLRDMRGMVLSLGLMLIGAVIGGPATWPWYLIWGVALLATDPRAQRSTWLAGALVVPIFLIRTDGEVAITLPHAWRAAIVMLAIVSIAAVRALRGRSDRGASPSSATLPASIGISEPAVRGLGALSGPQEHGPAVGAAAASEVT